MKWSERIWVSVEVRATGHQGSALDDASEFAWVDTLLGTVLSLYGTSILDRVLGSADMFSSSNGSKKPVQQVSASIL